MASKISVNTASHNGLLPEGTKPLPEPALTSMSSSGFHSRVMFTWILRISIPKLYHYDDVIMGAMASQITSLMNVYSTVYSGADQRKHQSSASLAFVWGIHRGPVNSPHKWPVTWKMFPFDDVIMMFVIYMFESTALSLRVQWVNLFCLNSLRLSDAYRHQETNHHYFRQWLVAWSVPSHNLNQSWNIATLTLGIFKCVIFKHYVINCIYNCFTKSALSSMTIGLFDDKSALVQVMAWCLQATSHCLS